MKYIFIIILLFTFKTKSFLFNKNTKSITILKGMKFNNDKDINKKNKKKEENIIEIPNLIGTFDYKILQYLKKVSSQKYSIIDKKNKIIYQKKNKKFINQIQNKKIISISPGGIQGFYFMGIMEFIKNNYNLSEIIYTGASAGAWVSLFSSYNKNSTEFVNVILNQNFNDAKSIMELQLMFKKKILENYSDDDFILSNIFIGVTVLKGFELSTNIFYNFENLEDAIDCCIASSHIPLLTGGFINKYNNEISFDGGFSNSPYLDNNNTIFNINPSKWKKNEDKKDFIDYYEITMNDNHNFTKLYQQGYKKAQKNKKQLDKIFTINKIQNISKNITKNIIKNVTKNNDCAMIPLKSLPKNKI